MLTLQQGAGGGPQESNTTAFLIRSLSSGWRKGSVVAVDAGVHLSAIERILESTQPPELATGSLSLPHTLASGPFSGMEVPHKTPAANAAHIARNLIDTYLITHPHLDHISGFVINTAGLPGTRPKRLAGLPSTINAFKAHIFNNVIWPNLSDENNGAGLVTYMRLVEGGSPAMGEEGYLEITDGLAVKTWSVSHGHCIERHSHRGSTVSRYGSMDASSANLSMSMSMASPRGFPFHASLARASSIGPSSQGCEGTGTPGGSCGGQSVCVYDSCAYFIRDVSTPREVLIFGDVEPDSISLSPRNMQIWQEAAPKVVAGNLAAILIECSYDDSRPDDRLFGHMIPRYLTEELKVLATHVEALKKASQTQSQGVFMSRTNSQGSGSFLARKKRKRGVTDVDESAIRKARHGSVGTGGEDLPLSPKSQMKAPTSNSRSASGSSLHMVENMNNENSESRRGSGATSNGGIETPHISTPTAELTLGDLEGSDADVPTGGPGATSAGLPPNNPPELIYSPDSLKGVKIVVIHVKDKQDDERPVGAVILEELLEHEKEARLGCEFMISYVGQSLTL
ncbi:hypothetical protein MKZ38_003731 [Zalerion maritima]|uniref:3',5'-cyclic-nucleotide phosphodiesterase n=1 Tax=Zalerion maritima TaxID=339359 RepID=A0AAD5RWN4_9PEZI|nr:hypothetical protein MKZ38_003731 [Zalerion maritima]